MTKVKTRPFMIFNSASGVFAIRQGKWKLIAGPGDGITPRFEIIHESGKTKPEFDPVTGKPIPFLYDWPPPRVPKESPAAQLYDLGADPREEVNLHAKRPEIVNRLAALLEKYKRTRRSR